MPALIRTVTNLMLIALAVHLVVGIGVRRLDSRPVGGVTAPESFAPGGLSAHRAPQPSIAPSVVTDRDLFDSAPPEVVTPPPPPTGKRQSPPPEGLPSLRGTIVGLRQESLAVMGASRNSPHHLYRTGDIVGGGEIRKILRKKVVLRIDGRDQEVQLETAWK